MCLVLFAVCSVHKMVFGAQLDLFPREATHRGRSPSKVVGTPRRKDKVVGVLFRGQGWGLTKRGLLTRVDSVLSVSALEAEAESVSNPENSIL